MVNVVEAKNASFTYWREGKHVFIAPKGTINAVTAPSFLNAYRKAAEDAEVNCVTVDCRELKTITSGGLRAFMVMKNALAQWKIYLINVSPDVMNILDETDFTSLFDIP